MHKLVILAFPRFVLHPMKEENVGEILVKAFLYEQDDQSCFGWRLEANRACDYEKTTGKLCIGSQIRVSGENVDAGTYLPVKVRINFIEWLDDFQGQTGDLLATKVELHLSAKQTGEGAILEVHEISCDKTVHVTVLQAA